MSEGRRWIALAANDLTKALANIVQALSYSEDGLCDMHVGNASGHLDEAHKKLLRARSLLEAEAELEKEARAR